MLNKLSWAYTSSHLKNIFAELLKSNNISEEEDKDFIDEFISFKDQRVKEFAESYEEYITSKNSTSAWNALSDIGKTCLKKAFDIFFVKGGQN